MGVVGALLCLTFLIMLFAFAPAPYSNFSFSGIAIPITVIFLTGIYFRAVKRDLPLTFTQLIRMGLLMTVVCVTLFLFLYFGYIKMNEAAFMEIFQSEYKEMMLHSKVYESGALTDDKLAKSIEEIKQMSPWTIVFKDFKLKFLFGIASTLIIAIILRK